jgi:methane/ammonia monooxygenase subunit B
VNNDFGRAPLVRRLAVSLAAVLILSLGAAQSAAAHGERAQEGFLRMQTVGFADVTFSSDTLEPGQELAISGTATVLDTWPRSLPDPRVGYVNVDTPGPVVLMKDRIVNGAPAADAIYIKRGASYAFTMTVVGRQPGRWHIHPTFAVEGAGTLIGPGQWITIQQSPTRASFSNP